jgi:anti-sigma regulatory factor (Ser/Thr protein kinase)
MITDSEDQPRSPGRVWFAIIESGTHRHGSVASQPGGVVVQQLHVPYAVGSVSDVRHRLVSELTELRLPGPTVEDVAVIVSELVGNALRHGRPLEAGDLVVSWEFAGDRLHLEVADGGPGPEPHPRHPTPDAEGGRGLLLVDTLSGRWGVRRGARGCVVWVDLRLKVGATRAYA